MFAWRRYQPAPLNEHGRLFDGQVIASRYRIVEFVAEGGMGVVYRATDLTSGERVALKQCPPEASPEDKRRFAREVRAMSRISHPNVMPVFDAQLEGQVPFFVMPEARCRLDERAAALRQALGDALVVFEAICNGVLAIHAAGQLHRDLKPMNVLLVEDRWVVSDLGLAVFADRDTTVLTRTSTLLGTEGYIAPELRRRDRAEADARVDVYSLGVVLYELVTGNDPAYVDESVLPVGLRTIVERAVAPNPANRYQSVRELQQEVAAYRVALSTDADPIARARSLANHPGQLTVEVVDALVHAFAKCDPLLARKIFDDLTDDRLAQIAELAPDSLQALLRHYADGLGEAISETPTYFEYADAVARRMTLVRQAVPRHPAASVALRCLLIAAVDLWRFKALETLIAVLEQTTDGEVAERDAEMLLRERERYARVLERHRPRYLAEPIRRVTAMIEHASQG